MKRLSLYWLAAAFIIAPAIVQASLTADQTPFHTYRGLWVSRFEYSSAAGIRTIMTNAANLGITDVMFQVRGRADAFYQSNYEVQASSYDALAVALAEGQSRGIKVHAWLNMVPLWSGTSLPSNPNHLINTNPEWWIRDSNNNPQPLNSSYVAINPTRPDVQQHLSNVVHDIASRYNVDGIHMDYIRMMHNSAGRNVVYPSDPFTVSLFQADNPGMHPSTHQAQYKDWIAGRLTDLVQSVYETTKAARPEAQVTAAVWRDPNIGLRDYQQDWAAWVEQGWLDAAMPMIYRKGFAGSDSGDLYRNNVRTAVNLPGMAGIMPGVGIYLQDDVSTTYQNIMNQYNYARDHGANGVQIFSYSSLFGSGAVAAERLRATRDFFNANSAAPPTDMIADFEQGNGYFRWSITLSGSNRNVASSSTVDRVDSEANTGDFSQRLTIDKTAGAEDFLARHLSGDPNAAVFGSNFQFASIGSVGFWLKTTTPDLQVALALDDPSTGDRSYFQNVIADGQWHRYEWFLNDDSHWLQWVSGGTGKIASRAAIDSIQFIGTGDSNVVFLDDVYYDAAAVAPNQWTRDADAVWSNAGNWSGTAPDGPGATANLLRRGTAPRTINVDQDITLGTLRFDNDTRYTLAGPGTIHMQEFGGAAISVVNRGSHRIAAPIQFDNNTTINVDRGSELILSGPISSTSGRLLFKRGEGMLEITGGQDYSSTDFIALGGTTNFRSDGGSELAVHALNAGTVVNFFTAQNLAGLHIGSGAVVRLTGAASNVLFTSALTLTGGGTLDIGNDLLIVRNVSPQIIWDLVRAGNGNGQNGGADGAEGAIVSHLAEADPSLALGLGLLEDAVLVRLTLVGDINLDGRVDGEDFLIWQSNFGALGATWADGDLNGDGRIDGEDFLLWQANFGQTISSTVFTPEPAALSLLMLAACGLMRRKRVG